MTSFPSILFDEELMLKVISYWGATDITRIASTSRRMRTALQRCWNVDRELACWFDCPSDFRQMLGQCGAVISGSTAIQFFNRVRYPSSDLDIVIPITTTYFMGTWLQENGYTFQPRDYDFTDFPASLVEVMKKNRPHRQVKPMVRVFDFYGHSLSTSDVGRHIQLITTRDDPFAHILHYHSTAVMNVITWRHAISLFPRQTFIARKTYVARSAYIGASTAWRQKYMARGFEIVQAFDDGVTVGRRYFGDDMCWVINFDTQDIDSDRVHVNHPHENLYFFVDPSVDAMNCALRVSKNEIPWPSFDESEWDELYEEDD